MYAWVYAYPPHVCRLSQRIEFCILIVYYVLSCGQLVSCVNSADSYSVLFPLAVLSFDLVSWNFRYLVFLELVAFVNKALQTWGVSSSFPGPSLSYGAQYIALPWWYRHKAFEHNFLLKCLLLKAVNSVFMPVFQRVRYLSWTVAFLQSQECNKKSFL